jgi:hypothetical protein
MKKVISKKVLVLLSLLLFLPLFSGCFFTPSVNQTPTITSTPITTATVKELYVYNVNATDPDSGDTLTYSLTTNPSGMTIDSTTGLINWTPTSAQIGNHNVTVEVSDGSLSDTQSFIIIVSKAPIIPPPTPTNHAPIITFIPDTLATVGVLYTYDVNATDSDGDALTYSLTANPTDMTIDSATGLINWRPTFVQIGDHNVTVEVSDGSLSDTQSFTITVHDVLDHIVVLPETMTLFEGGETESIASITAHYNNGATAIIDLADCSYISDTVGVATVAVGVVTTVDPGTATITVTYIEGGITETDTVVVTVNPIPNLELTPSTQSVAVGNPVTINILVENVTDLMGANITLNFDATKLQHVSSTAGSFFSLAFVIPTVDNVNGSVTLALLTLAEKPSGTGNIITVNFNTVDTGVADITFGTTILRDKTNANIVHTKGSGYSITIN